jgi:isocitrate/isopropylmalate dehydrogenase
MAVPCTLIPGDGIGPDITDATVRILEAAGAQFDWDRRLAGMAAVAAFDDPMPDETIESIENTGLALKGAARDARRRRLSLGERRPAARVRSVCERTSRAVGRTGRPFQ